ncbi:MAG: PspC domain-containing protein [Bacteroides sp.]|nr:PspC domain-containing protein [Bacteroides sp.]MBQ8223944.1 PspC domain-containing protein [Bacteroides sp.]
MNKKLRRSTKDCKIAGVCGGLAEYFDIDSTIVRIVYLIASLCSAAFPGLLIYLILMLVMPKDNNVIEIK